MHHTGTSQVRVHERCVENRSHMVDKFHQYKSMNPSLNKARSQELPPRPPCTRRRPQSPQEPRRAHHKRHPNILPCHQQSIAARLPRAFQTNWHMRNSRLKGSHKHCRSHSSSIEMTPPVLRTPRCQVQRWSRNLGRNKVMTRQARTEILLEST